MINKLRAVLLATVATLLSQVANAEDPQLFLSKSEPPKKGYVEADKVDADGKILFRECYRENEPIWLPRKNLEPISGRCADGGAWAGTILEVSPSGSAVVEIEAGETVNIDKKVWLETFGTSRDSWPDVGAAVGGYGKNDPTRLFAIDPRF